MEVPLFIALFAGSALAATLDVTYVFTGIEEGYDHTHRLEIFADGNSVGMSPEGPQSKKGHVQVEVPDGRFALRIVDSAFYDGKWEEHTVANDYSLDCVVERTLTARKKHKLAIVFDIDNGVTVKGK
jgi:hypothetical protein